MKAFLLAAGLGSRLRPLTDSIPKCMVPIGGRPLLDIWLDAFDRAGVSEVMVNLHHLPGVVRRHLADRTGPPVVRTFFEPRLLGSAGTLAANRRWVAEEQFFLACYADNLTDFDLRSLIESCEFAYRKERISVTVSVGVASCAYQNNEDPGVIIADADAALYESKRAGRNRVLAAPSK